jgi:uncharacterized protein YdaU (DUF1376 family)
MSKHFWFAFHFEDYTGDTRHLNFEQHGAYLLLMCHYYRKREPLPAHAESLYRICGCMSDSEKRAVDEVLAQFFVRNGEFYRHHRIDRELVKAAEISEKRGKAAEKRWQEESDANAYAEVMQMHSQLQLQQQPEQKKKKPSRSNEREDSDPRHVPIREAIKRQQDQAGVSIQWNGRSAKELSKWLDANPQVSVDRAIDFVRNKFMSEETRGDPPWEWIPKLSKYAEGPLDRFGRLPEADWRVGYEGMTHNSSEYEVNMYRELPGFSADQCDFLGSPGNTESVDSGGEDPPEQCLKEA